MIVDISTRRWGEETRRALSLARSRQAPAGLPTGLPTLDRRIGGLLPKSLVIVAGYTGNGKTSLAMQMAWDAARYQQRIGDPRPVLVFNGEMHPVRLMQREVARQTGIPLLKMLAGELDEMEQAQFDAVIDELMGLPVLLDDSPGLSVARIDQKVGQLGGEVAMVIVDHLQLAAKRGAPPYVAVTEVIHLLREMRDAIDGTFVALSQLRRKGAEEGESPRPRLTDLRDSGAIEENANLVLLVSNPQATNGEASVSGTLPAELIVAKNRDGWTGRIPLRFWPERVAFSEEDEALEEAA